MCGIVGIFKLNNKVNIDYLTFMKSIDIMKHRGPDESGFYFSKKDKIALGHRRLSIIDIDSGQQPMKSTDGKIILVFNGEIYNYKELREDLIFKGYRFRTNSDTEVIIYYYKEYGTEFQKFNGIFSFALFDQQQNILILARDQLGVKPLYYYLNEEEIIFGSEIKSILVNMKGRKELDINSLDTFLTFRYNPAPLTLFKGIKKIQAGHYLKINSTGENSVKRYWGNNIRNDLKINYKDSVIEYNSLLSKAVNRQLISDVPVGLFLSGGIDSAFLGKKMSQRLSKFKTFTIGFEGKGDFNELKNANKTAKFLGSQHFEMVISQKEYLDFFYKSFYYLEEPIAHTTIPALYYVSRLASRHVKVVLAGQGADEPLGGYKRYLGEKIFMQYFNLINLLPINFVNSLFKNKSDTLYRFYYASKFKNESSRFLAIHSIFTPEMKKNLLKKDILLKIKSNNENIIKEILDTNKNDHDSLSRLLYLDTRLSLSDDLLLFGDKMTMANSLEMRVPYLDLELISFLESIPSKYKISFFNLKRLHKSAAKLELPSEIINRKKRGFSTPMDSWLKTTLLNEITGLFLSEECKLKEYINVDYVLFLLKMHKNNMRNYERQLFILFSLEIWLRNFINNEIL